MFLYIQFQSFFLVYNYSFCLSFKIKKCFILNKKCACFHTFQSIVYIFSKVPHPRNSQGLQVHQGLGRLPHLRRAQVGASRDEDPRKRDRQLPYERAQRQLRVRKLQGEFLIKKIL